MSETAISCEGLSKQYRLGERESYKALRDVITDAAASPFRRLRSALSSNGSAGSNGNSSATRNPKLETRNSFWALDDVSFEVKRGEVIGVIGRNGAGKSTLLKILSRITKPTKGHAKIHGRVGSLLEVGTGFHPELTGRENIYLNAAILGMRKAEVARKFDEIVAFAEVEKFIDTPVKRYSSGMYVRLAFAVAAHMETEILVVDEVLAVGDAEFQKKCLGRMEEVGRQGRTVLFVSHNMNAVEQLCTKVFLLEAGRIIDSNSDVRSVTRKYLLGGEPRNLLPNKWTNAGGEFSNPWFTPVKFNLCDHNGRELSMPVSNDSDMRVQIEGDIDVVDPALTIGYAIYSETGTLLYWSYQTDQDESCWPKLLTGGNVMRGRIPTRLLNEGLYRIELIGGLHYRQWLFAPGETVPCIYLQVQGGLSNSPYWMGKRPGVLAPVMEWEQVNGE
jgi:lipopolysaccharide transport system ATP-binding protein